MGEQKEDLGGEILSGVNSPLAVGDRKEEELQEDAPHPTIGSPSSRPEESPAVTSAGDELTPSQYVAASSPVSQPPAKSQGWPSHQQMPPLMYAGSQWASLAPYLPPGYSNLNPPPGFSLQNLQNLLHQHHQAQQQHQANLMGVQARESEQLKGDVGDDKNAALKRKASKVMLSPKESDEQKKARKEGEDGDPSSLIRRKSSGISRRRGVIPSFENLTSRRGGAEQLPRPLVDTANGDVLQLLRSFNERMKVAGTFTNVGKASHVFGDEDFIRSCVSVFFDGYAKKATMPGMPTQSSPDVKTIQPILCLGSPESGMSKYFMISMGPECLAVFSPFDLNVTSQKCKDAGFAQNLDPPFASDTAKSEALVRAFSKVFKASFSAPLSSLILNSPELEITIGQFCAEENPELRLRASTRMVISKRGSHWSPPVAAANFEQSCGHIEGLKPLEEEKEQRSHDATSMGWAGESDALRESIVSKPSSPHHDGVEDGKGGSIDVPPSAEPHPDEERREKEKSHCLRCTRDFIPSEGIMEGLLEPECRCLRWVEGRLVPNTRRKTRNTTVFAVWNATFLVSKGRCGTENVRISDVDIQYKRNTASQEGEGEQGQSSSSDGRSAVELPVLFEVGECLARIDYGRSMQRSHMMGDEKAMDEAIAMSESAPCEEVYRLNMNMLRKSIEEYLRLFHNMPIGEAKKEADAVPLSNISLIWNVTPHEWVCNACLNEYVDLSISDRAGGRGRRRTGDVDHDVTDRRKEWNIRFHGLLEVGSLPRIEPISTGVDDDEPKPSIVKVGEWGVVFAHGRTFGRKFKEYTKERRKSQQGMGGVGSSAGLDSDSVLKSSASIDLYSLGSGGSMDLRETAVSAGLQAMSEGPLVKSKEGHLVGKDSELPLMPIDHSDNGEVREGVIAVTDPSEAAGAVVAEPVGGDEEHQLGGEERDGRIRAPPLHRVAMKKDPLQVPPSLPADVDANSLSPSKMPPK
uniref:Uncharacterized protein n=1 Tax=Palpitomonas bilix TaxID=652834 RepID=A0A7S3FZ03_9EUKA|mmetsp:Transcript_11439/g.30263  ORF Transcript_11439/g.30263 Transcript_11439/m.30263 type:complete len:975 (+) Transcript_11439:54-2978(+)